MQRNQILRNKDKGMVVEVLHACNCTEPCKDEVEVITENTVEAAHEKHIPVVTGDAHGTHVCVGSVAHPMSAEHFIEWIEVINGPYVNRKYLEPGEKPEADFYVPYSKDLVVRAYCNLHGLWKA